MGGKLIFAHFLATINLAILNAKFWQKRTKNRFVRHNATDKLLPHILPKNHVKIY